MRTLLHWPALLFGLIALPTTVSAHRLDELLQATLVTVASSEVRLQINLTPGVAVAEKVLGLIDRNHDGVISSAEAAGYCEALRRHLSARLDHHKVRLKLVTSNFPPVDELRTGEGIIQVEFCGKVGPALPGAHQFTLSNRHLPGLSVYLFNAAQPRPGSLQILGQKRNQTQSAGEIDFKVL